MEKVVRSCDKEYMRVAMLKHEETFKEQVYELHRLYCIQKIMMKNMEARRDNEVSEREWYFKNAISLTQNAHHEGAKEKPKMKFENLDEAEIELTLGPSSYNCRKKLETPLASDSHSLYSSSNGSTHIKKTRCRFYKSNHTTMEESSGSMRGLVQLPDSTSGRIRNSFGIEEQLEQERLKQSPWLLQVLNLNMT
ncbi:hypothetical protein TanjilG_11068 [Lupinus angustifolius]|uniref:Uncharacterized protein n=1 Tax=Lupinus angustifolius TaxID=3871 RepID=A0A1J7FZM5_LUPAN|nr:PREDICTED: uncharacterized protein LOC109332661 [Lupinus angustifolius]OIV93486.1 hypothetical protein TanjilG_11068 [Lupinus angustifolius]